MADGFEPYHVPQQSRRDKLRVNNPNPVDSLSAALVPLYDPSLLPSDFLTCAAATLHRQSFTSSSSSGSVKPETLMGGFAGAMSMINPTTTAAASSSGQVWYADPQLSVQLNPSHQDHVNGGSPYHVYHAPLSHHHHQNYRVPDHSFHQHGNDQVVVYKPEPLSVTAHHEGNSCNTSGQSLSLSLSSHHTKLPLELNLQRYDSTMFTSTSDCNNNNKNSHGGYVVAGGNGGSSSIELSRSTVPLGPFTGYASVLKGSRFLRPAQQLLEELCDVGRGVEKMGMSGEASFLEPPPSMESLTGGNGVVDDSLNCIDGAEQTRKKSRLLSMLDEVYKRYKQYYQEMQNVVASFESVAGLSSAAPFAYLALKAMCKHFRALKNAITDQLQFSTKSHGKFSFDEAQRMENSGRGAYGHRSFHGPGFVDQPVWRPQRGLPERAVTVLRAWLFEHFLHPYPTDTDKLMLAKQTGLSRNQVSNWFINARVRLWKPMVEEIHMLETRQNQKSPSSQREDQPSSRLTDQQPTSCPIEYDNASSSTQRIAEFPLKRTREDLTETPRGSEGPMNLPYDSLSHHHYSGVGMSNASVSGGVSLTLGLHQNSGGISDSYPLNAARRFGLDGHSEGYVVSGFAGQNRQFGRDVMGGQLLHDFVG